MGKIVAVCVSDKKGMRKKDIRKAHLKENFGIENDAHASSVTHRQVSLLAIESIDKMRKLGLNVGPGDFAENLTTRGVDLLSLKVGERISINGTAMLEVTQLGKVCHSRCSIYYQAGDCVMPKEGVFAGVLKGGVVKPGDRLEVIKDAKRTK